MEATGYVGNLTVSYERSHDHHSEMNTVALMKELMLDEGYKQEIYADPLGHLTFGVGHLITENDEEYGARSRHACKLKNELKSV